MKICSEEKVKAVKTLCAIILLDSLNSDKNLTQFEIHLISNKCQQFQQSVLKMNSFSSSMSIKGANIKIQILKLKFHSSDLQTLSGSINGKSCPCFMSEALNTCTIRSGHEAITS